MPELPEVETHVRELAPVLHGRTITGAAVYWPRTVAAPTSAHFVEQIVGQQFVAFERRGKYMLLRLRTGATLVVHLRMTGHLLVLPGDSRPDKHTHLVLDLDDGRQLHFQDARKFGRVWLVDDPTPVFAKLGPEPLSTDFTIERLTESVARRNVSIKTLLLDQTVIAGVGNIYADEALHRAGIHPNKRGRDLSLAEITALHAAIQSVLTAAIAQNGSSLGSSFVQNYLRPSGEPGGYQDAHEVYGRKGQPCLRCGSVIERIVLAQRSAHFCPVCQPPPSA
jgi:formamidopyrimidine-DNA glycosylase